MPVPGILVQLATPLIPGGVNIEKLLSQETAAILTSIIEDPTGTNSFTTGDVTLKGYDVPNGLTVRNYFSTMTPLSTNFAVSIVLQILPGISDVVLQGYVAPNTLVFEPRTGMFSFTVIGVARRLQTTDASTLFLRSGYFDGKWYLFSDASLVDQFFPTLQVATGTPTNVPDFLPGDILQFADGTQVTVVDVLPDPATSPPVFWTVRIAQPLSKSYPQLSPLTLATPYRRSMKLHDVVAGLFTAAGFPSELYFFSAALPNLGSLFVTPMDLTGLPGGYGNGIAVAPESGGILVAVAGPSGAYTASSGNSGWSLNANSTGFLQPPLDATNYGTAATMFGVRRFRSRAGLPRFGVTVTMKFYGYDHLAGNKRYIYTVTCDANVAPGVAFNITTKLESETCTPGVWIWGTTTLIGGIGISTTTTTDLSTLYDAIGIDVDPATGTVFFTDIQLTGAAGTPITMTTASYQPGGAGYVAARANINGPIVMTGPGRCSIFQVDGILGANPQVSTFTLTAAGVMSAIWNQTVSPYIIGRTFKKNAGDGRYYALISSPQGVYLTSWSSDAFFSNTNQTIQVSPPPPRPAQTTTLFQRPYEVDLVVQYGVSNGPGIACPMFALLGGVPFYISNTGSGVIPYADMTGLSVADALQQLSTIIAGIFFVTPSGVQNLWTFRSRSTPAVGDTIAAVVNSVSLTDQIDGDSGLISLTVQPVFNRWIGYVSVTHETDKTIFGDTSNISGSVAYKNASGMNLQLTTRFVSSSSFAAALANSLYNYLGSQKRWVEVNRIRDGRLYNIGKTFHAFADGVNRNFQIIETDVVVAGVTVKVIGLEV